MAGALVPGERGAMPLGEVVGALAAGTSGFDFSHADVAHRVVAEKIKISGEKMRMLEHLNKL